MIGPLDGCGVAAEVVALKYASVTPGLTVVLVGDDAASAVYVGAKEKASREAGMTGETIRLPASTSQAELLALVERLNVDALFREDGEYTYRNGVNPRAVIALVVSVLPVVPGFIRAATTPGGVVPDPGLLDTLYSFAWFVTFALSALLYFVLMRGSNAAGSPRNP